MPGRGPGAQRGVGAVRNGGWGRARGARPPKPTQEGGGPPSCPRRAKKLDSFTAPPHTAPTYIALYPPKRLSLRRELASASVDDTDSPTSVTLAQRGLLATNRTPVTPDVRLYHRAVVVAQEATGERGVGCAEQGGGGGGGGGREQASPKCRQCEGGGGNQRAVVPRRVFAHPAHNRLHARYGAPTVHRSIRERRAAS